jgi:hypothetical protein
MKEWEPFKKIDTREGIAFVGVEAKKVPIIYTNFCPNIHFSMSNLEQERLENDVTCLRNFVKQRLIHEFEVFLDMLDDGLEQDPDYLKKWLYR